MISSINIRKRMETISNNKEQIGELLLRLQTPMEQNEEKEAWLLFEALLSQYVEEKYEKSNNESCKNNI